MAWDYMTFQVSTFQVPAPYISGDLNCVRLSTDTVLTTKLNVFTMFSFVTKDFERVFLDQMNFSKCLMKFSTWKVEVIDFWVVSILCNGGWHWFMAFGPYICGQTVVEQGYFYNSWLPLLLEWHPLFRCLLLLLSCFFIGQSMHDHMKGVICV